MKKICLALAVCTVSSLCYAAPQFQTTCQLDLAGVKGTKTTTAKSPEYAIYLPTGSSQARVSADDLTLYAQIDDEEPRSLVPFVPTFFMELYRGGNPVQGSISMVHARGIDFANWQVGQSQSLSSSNFISGADYSRVDYSCEIKRVR